MFLNYMNNFRGAAILFIVAVHCLHKLRTVFGWDSSALSYATVAAVISNGTVLFVFISGFLFQHLSARFTYGGYLSSKWRNIILPYLVISVPAVILHIGNFTSLPNPYAGQPVPLQVALFYITGLHLLPLWFIPMITLFYLISPGLIKLDRARWPYWLLPPLLAVASVVPRAFDNVLQSFVHYFPVYLFGMFCSRYRIEVLRFVERYLAPLTALFVGMVALDTWILYGSDRVIPTNYLSLWNKLILALLLMYLLYRYDDSVKRRFDVLASTSFGIYFVHQYVIELSGRFIPTTVTAAWLRVSIFLTFTLAITTISIVLLRLAKRVIGPHSRLLIGY